LKSWILAARPKTLTAAVIPIVAASALVHFEGHEVQLWIVWSAIFSALCIQIATNFINDAIDFHKGADTATRIGPTRATQAGLLTKKQIMWMAFALLFLGVLVGIPLVLHGGLPILIVGLISVFMAYSYTAGPFPLAYLGLGDLFVVIFFGLVSVGGVYYLLTGNYNFNAFILGLQIGFLSTVLIAINNLRDVHQDRLVNKKTLAVRFGIRFVRIEIATLIASTYLLQFYWLKSGFLKDGSMAAMMPLSFLPLALHIVRRIATQEPSSRYNDFLAQSALLHSGFGLIISVGLYLA
jgi:1,4-dihydroxy-2-naphthoate octaprenyltransferase